MLSALKGMVGKHPKTTSPAQQPPEILYEGKASNGVTITVVQENEEMRKIREKVVENAAKSQQLKVEIADAKRQQQEASAKAAQAKANIEASKQREEASRQRQAQLQTDVQQLQLEKQQIAVKRQQLQQEIADDDAEMAKLMAQLAQIEQAQQDAQLTSKI